MQYEIKNLPKTISFSAEFHFDGESLNRVELSIPKKNQKAIWLIVAPTRKSSGVEKLKSWVDGYFAGSAVFPEELIPGNCTEFQRKVYRALIQVPFGKKVSYMELAKMIKSPKACRAVAQSCKKNRLPLVIPCHRVIRHDGSLGGFNLGAPLKIELLAYEERASQITI